MAEGIFWLGHDSFRLQGEKVVYIDPWKLAADAEKADVILVTHDHYDHFSPEDVKKISKADTVIVAPPAVAAKGGFKFVVVKPGDKISASGIAIEVVAAYNPHKQFHPRTSGHVGYIVTLNGKRIYHAGDTDEIPEMAQIHCDIALLPVSGTYVMTASEAARVANLLKPSLAIPMHYDTIVGSRKDAEEFKRLTQVPVEILEKSK